MQSKRSWLAYWIDTVVCWLSALPWLIALAPAQAQNPLTASLQLEDYCINYTSHDGLPSSTVHEVFEDSDGYIWFCTSLGVSRFDGQSFINIGSDEGICSDAVIHVTEDSQNRLWFWTDRNEIFSIDYKTLETTCMSFNDTLVKLIGSDLINGLYVNNGSIYIHTIHGQIVHILFDFSNNHFEILSYERITDLSEDGYPFLYKRIQGYGHIILKHKFGKYASYFDIKGERLGLKYGWVRGGGEYFFSHRKKISRFDTLRNVPMSENNIPGESTGNLYYIDGKLWAGTFNNGLYIFNADHNLSIDTHMLPGLTITGVLKDREGGYWISSFGQGVFYYPKNGVALTDKHLSVGATFMDHNSIHAVIGTSTGACYKFDPDEPDSLKHLATLTPFQKYLGFVGEYPNEFIAQDAKIDLHTRNVSHTYRHHLEFMDTNGMYFQLVFNGKIARILEHYKEIEIIHSDWEWGRPKFTLDVNSQYSYLAAQKGLVIFYKAKREFSKVELTKNKEGSPDITFLQPYDSNRLLVASSNSGLFMVRENQTIFHLNKYNGLSTNNCTSIAPDSGNTFWVGTDAGIYLVHCTSDSIKILTTITNHTGYDINHVTCITAIDRWLLAGTENQIFRLDKKKLTIQTKGLGVKFESAFHYDNKLTMDNDGAFILEPWQRSISLRFSSPSFKNAFHHQYRYRVLELNENWNSIDKAEINLTGLAPGAYHVMCEKLNYAGIWQGGHPAIKILVQPPFYKTTWFLSLIASIIIATILYITAMRIRFYKKESALQIGLVKTRNQTLSSQLNPHFLYNVLNTVGGSIVREEKQDAVQTISKFSKLMRMVFDNSQHDLVPLDVELQAVSAYIELEKKRLVNSFEFYLEGTNISNEELGMYMVPPLLLQPLVENSIWHGISEMESKGVVKLGVKKENGLLVISVMDNGKGLKSEKLNGQRKSSLKIIIDRMALLSQIYGPKVSWNLLSETQSGWKTKIDLQFPIIYKNSRED